MAAGWKKIILTDLEAHLNEVSSSGYIWTSASLSSDASDNVLVRDSVTGEVRVLSQSVVGGEGSSLLTFATMSAGGVSITSSAVGTLFITSSDGNPLTVVGTQDDTITIATDTASLETVQDTTAAMLTGGNLNYSSYSLNHQDITFNYDDAGGGTFSITGSSAITSSNTTGQQGVELILTEDGANVELSAYASGLNPTSSVTFNDVTASNLPLTTSNILSASSLYVTESAYLQSDLTMSGDFIFQGFQFGDAQVLVHSGSNIFGSGSENDTPHPTQNNHQFTGSIFVTGSGITLDSGSTSGPNSFYGDGSGLTNLPTESLPSGLLSSSQQISASISGAFSTDQITLQTASNSSGVISALTATITDNESALATGGQIYSFWNTTSGSFLNYLNDNLFSEVTASHLGGMRFQSVLGNVFNANTDPFIHIDNLESAAIQSQSDSILFEDVSISDGLNNGEDGFKNRKITIANFAAFITSSVGYPLGTVTGITAGNGITVDSSTSDLTVSINLSGSEYTSDVGADSTLYHDSNLIANANNLALRSKIKLDTLTAPTASFAYLKAYDADSLVSLNSTTVTVDDNFIIMNANATSVGEDGGITIKRGLGDNANLFWNESSKRWSINNTDLTEGSTTASPDSYIITATGTTSSPAVDSFPTYGNSDGTNAEGSIHINTNASTPEVWIWA